MLHRLCNAGLNPKLQTSGLRILVFSLLSASAASGSAIDPPAMAFVRTSGTEFTMDGKTFFVTGVNNHYLTFGSHDEVARVLDVAARWAPTLSALSFNPVIGSLDGTRPHDLGLAQSSRMPTISASKARICCYWDPQKGAMAINDGPNGMQKVDFLLAEARKRHLKLILSFLDFWAFTGGAQQMLAWYGSTDKATFFFRDTSAPSGITETGSRTSCIASIRSPGSLTATTRPSWPGS